MGLETATYINTLNEANPTSGDPLAQGDDHLRMIKQVLKSSFPQVNGALNGSMVAFTPVGNIAATTVSAALAELDTKKALASHTHTAGQVSGLGSAALLDAGTSANQLVQLTGAGALPAVSGANLTNLPSSGIPAGGVGYFAMGTAPTGWLKANGALVSRTTYADLFAAIGVLFGAGDGVNTFTLPDLRGEFVRGLDDGRGVDAARTIGSAQAGANASHSHGAGTLTAASAGAHTHNYSVGNSATSSGAQASTSAPLNSGTTSSAGAHTHSLSGTTATDGSEARPRNIALLACIKF